MSSFQTYMLGYIILIMGLAFGASLLGVPGTWIAVGATVLIGTGIIAATRRTRPKDPQKSLD